MLKREVRILCAVLALSALAPNAFAHGGSDIGQGGYGQQPVGISIPADAELLDCNKHPEYCQLAPASAADESAPADADIKE